MENKYTRNTYIKLTGPNESVAAKGNVFSANAIPASGFINDYQNFNILFSEDIDETTFSYEIKYLSTGIEIPSHFTKINDKNYVITLDVPLESSKKIILSLPSTIKNVSNNKNLKGVNFVFESVALEPLQLLTFLLNGGKIVTSIKNVEVTNTYTGFPVEMRISKLPDFSDTIWVPHSDSFIIEVVAGVNEFYFQLKNDRNEVSNILHSAIYWDGRQIYELDETLDLAFVALSDSSNIILNTPISKLQFLETLNLDFVELSDYIDLPTLMYYLYYDLTDSSLLEKADGNPPQVNDNVYKVTSTALHSPDLIDADSEGVFTGTGIYLNDNARYNTGATLVTGLDGTEYFIIEFEYNDLFTSADVNGWTYSEGPGGASSNQITFYVANSISGGTLENVPYIIFRITENSVSVTNQIFIDYVLQVGNRYKLKWWVDEGVWKVSVNDVEQSIKGDQPTTIIDFSAMNGKEWDVTIGRGTAYRAFNQTVNQIGLVRG